MRQHIFQRSVNLSLHKNISVEHNGSECNGISPGEDAKRGEFGGTSWEKKVTGDSAKRLEF